MNNLIDLTNNQSGPIAQLGERNAGSVEVIGSIPFGSTIKLDLKIPKI